MVNILLWALSGVVAWEWFNNRAEDGETTPELISAQVKWILFAGVAAWLGWRWLKKRGA
ncbi:hypothetical protein [Magnetovibrio blakemorei]|uniref:hypothetical protein n=1 Tax=Magnetovibrio blakemorei TaxID=28181 RepID=UPI00147ABA2F|nr:hypothetical protein [Magnetovibrio blakemorei]